MWDVLRRSEVVFTSAFDLPFILLSFAIVAVLGHLIENFSKKPNIISNDIWGGGLKYHTPSLIAAVF